MSRIAWVLGVVLLVTGCWWLYNHNKNKDMLGSGLVISPNPPDSKEPSESSSGVLTNDRAPATTQPVPATPAPALQPAAPSPAAKPGATLPVSDTLSPQPPAGMAFGGSGKYQWYRQGDITWRIDTQHGTTCIAFATMEEWQKRVVYTHGCSNA